MTPRGVNFVFATVEQSSEDLTQKVYNAGAIVMNLDHPYKTIKGIV